MDITLQFLGAAQNVTGSCYYLQANGTKLLVDCGFYQERHFRYRNWEPFVIPPKQIDVVLLTHAHLDHCGLLPKLVKEGFKGRVICTQATAEIAHIVMADAAKIQEEDAKYKRKRHRREGRKSKHPVEPLFTIENAEECFGRFAPIRYNETVAVAEGIDAVFHDTGHILGASAIQITIQHKGETRRVVFSGDVGCENKPILKDPVLFEQADYCLCESTYGDRLHDKSVDVKEQLREVINSTHKAGGNVIIPSFAVERCQELIYYLNELLLEDSIPHLMAFVDSPMAVKVTDVFKKHPELFDHEMMERLYEGDSPFELPGLNMVRNKNQSKAINNIRGTAIIIAGSGMCTGGRIKHHLVNNITQPENTILFVGYQAVGTLGRQLIEGKKEVRILGSIMPVKARIAEIRGFSAHGDRDELVQWLSGFKEAPRHVFVTHGEENASQRFAEFLAEKTGWPTSVPEYQQEVILD